MAHGRSLGILGLVSALVLVGLGVLPAVGRSTTATVTGHVYDVPEGQEAPSPDARGVAGVTVSDGQNMTRTDASGRYELEVDLERRHTDLVFISVPMGYTVDPDEDMVPQFYQHLEVDPGETATVDFTVRQDHRQRDRVYRALSLADVHVQAGTTNNRERFSHQIDQLNELVQTAANGPDARRETPRFTVVAGDLTNDATDNEFLDYRAASATSLIPIWPAVGNHEYFPGAGSGYADIIDNYRRHMGPEWYSFSHGREHFVILENNSQASLTDDAQLEWLRQDLEWNAQGKTVVVLTHKPFNNPETVNPDRVEEYIELLEQYNTRLLLAGHTHSNDATGDVIDGAVHAVTNSASYTIDQTPNGFRVLDFGRGRGVDLRFRKFETLERTVTAVHPAPDARVPAEPTQIIVNAYHTSSWATGVRARTSGGDGWIPLDPRGEHAWVAPFDASELDEGTHELTVEVTDNGGDTVVETTQFEIVPAGSTETPNPDVDWAMFHGDAQHSGVAAGELSPELGLAWAWHSENTILTSSPALHDGGAFVGIRDENGPEGNAIAAVDVVTGEERWRVPADAQVVASPAAVDGIVYAGSIRGTTYAIDAASGKVLWTHTAGPDRTAGRAWQYFSPTVADGVVYQPYQLHGAGTKLGAFDARSGEQLWETDGSLGSAWISHASPAVGENHVYVVAGGVINAVDRQTGAVAWTSQPAGGWMRSMPMYADGLVLMNYQGDVLVAVDAETGQEVWRYSSPASSHLHGNGTASVAAVADGVAYVGFADGNVTAIDVRHGSALWSHRTDGGVISSPAVSGDYVYIGSNDGHVYGLDRQTGQPLWRFEIGTWVASSPAVSGNTVVVGAWDGALYAFTPDGSEPTERWPRTTATGVVSDDDGDPVAGARILVLDGDDVVGQARSADDGAYRVTVVGEPAAYEVVAVRRGYLGARGTVDLTEDGAEERLDLELELVREPIAVVADTPTDFRHSNAHTESVRIGDTYHVVMNDRVQANISSRVAGNDTPGTFAEGWLADFALTDDIGMETLDWTEYLLTTAEPGPPDWNRPGERLPLPDISVEGDTVVASGAAEIDSSLEASVTYRALADAPVVKMTLELTNTGDDDFSGYFHYNIDPDSGHDTAIVPGAGTNPGFIDGGWTANYVYDGPTNAGVSQPAHAIAWLEDEPHTLSAHGYIFGAWFDMSTAAGETTEVSWYHITDYPAAGGDVTANIARWADQLDHLDDDAQARPRVTGTVRDDAGQPVPAARVALRDEAGTTVAETRAGEDGAYSVVVGSGGLAPGTYDAIAWTRGYLPEPTTVTVDADGATADLTASAITEPVAGVTDVPPDVNPSGPWMADVVPGDTYHYVANDRAQVTISSRVGPNNAPGTFAEGWLADFALSDELGVETLDWAEYVLTTAPPQEGADWNRPGEWLPLPDVSVDGDTVVASGAAQIDEDISGTMRYRMLPGAPVLELTLTLENTGSEDFDGWFHYSLDPDSQGSGGNAWDRAIVPGIPGLDPGLVTEGWTSNYVYDGPQAAGTPSPAQAIAWLDDEPAALSARGYIVGAWFDASTPAGETTRLRWYHISDYAAEGDDPTAAVAEWAARLADLGDEAGGE